MVSFALLSALAGCTPGPTLVGEVSLEELDDAPLSRALSLRSDVPGALSAVLTSPVDQVVVTFPTLDVEHAVTLSGFRLGEVTEVAVRLTDAKGRTREVAVLEVHPPPFLDGLPVAEILTMDPDRSEGGYWLVPIEIPDETDLLALYDAVDLVPVWAYTGPANFGDVRFSGRGTVIGLAAGGITEVDPAGELVGYLGESEEVEPRVAELPWPLTHEVHPLADGTFLTLAQGQVRVEEYPLSYEEPEGPLLSAMLTDLYAVHVGADGAILSSVPMSARIDTARIGYGSLGNGQFGYDWTHGNAILPHPDGGVVVSLRHQDALVRLDAAGELGWILGDPAGYREPWSEALLAPEPGLVWPYHQHGPEIDEEGVLWALDNRSQSTTPYSGLGELAERSRIVGFAVDEAARTVRQVAAWTPADDLRSTALGNVDILPRTGHVLGAFGMLRAENGVDNALVGWGNNLTRIVEVDPAVAEPFVDVRLRTDLATSPGGVNVYRVEPAASLDGLYPPGTVVTRVRSP